MKRFKIKCLGSVAIISLLACASFIQAHTAVPQVHFHHQQVNSHTVHIELDIEQIGSQVVALEVSFVADDIQEVIKMTSPITNSYTTYQLQNLEDGKEKLSFYMVSEDKDMPLVIEDNPLSTVIFDLKTSGKLEIDETAINVKVIEKEYKPTNYKDVDFIYTEAPYQSGQDTDSDHIDNGNTNNGNINNGNTNSGNTNGTEDSKEPIDFKDIENHWAKSAIINMSSKGIIKGYTDGSFKPNAAITRAEFAALLARAFKMEYLADKNPFSDVQQDKWYTESVLALYEAGIISGRTDGTFGVQDLITNEEISTMLYRTLKVLNMEMKESDTVGIQFVDATKISAYAKEAVESLVKMGIIYGRPDGSFGPQDSTSRAQVAVMLERILIRLK